MAFIQKVALTMLTLFSTPQQMSIYKNSQYKIEVMMPKDYTVKSSSYDHCFGKVSFIRVSGTVKEQNGIISYNNLYRVIAENVNFKKELNQEKAQVEFVQNVINQNMAAIEENNFKLVSEKRRNYSDKIQLDWTSESDVLIEKRRIILKYGSSYTISLMTAKNIFNEKEKETFFNSLKIK
jgi:hypothetical protein